MTLGGNDSIQTVLDDSSIRSAFAVEWVSMIAGQTLIRRNLFWTSAHPAFIFIIIPGLIKPELREVSHYRKQVGG